MKLSELFRPESKYQAGDILKKAGYEKLGNGNYADVWYKDGSDFVVKIFRDSDVAYPDFVNMTRNNPNPHFPKFKSKPIKIGHDFYGIRMEKLSPNKLSPKIIMIIEHYIDCRAKKWVGNWDAFMKTNFSKPDGEMLNRLLYDNPQLQQAMDLIAVEMIEKGSHYLDIVAANIMQRGNTIVFTDPVS